MAETTQNSTFLPFSINSSEDLNISQLCQSTGTNETHIHEWPWFYCIASIYAPTAVFVDRFVTPFWYFIGFFGNIITIKVWNEKQMRKNSTSALYLIVLAICDLLLLCLHVFKELHFAWMIPTLGVPIWCPVFFIFYMFTQYMSPLLVFGFTLERFISTIRPFKCDRFSRHRRARKEICAIILFALMISTVQYEGWIFKNGDCTGPRSEFFSTWSWTIDIVMFGVFPFTVFVLNIFVLRAANKSIALMEQSSELRRNSTCKVGIRESNLSPSTLTLLVVSFYRIFTTLSATIAYTIQHEIPIGSVYTPVSEMATDPTWRNYFTYFLIKQIIDEIGLSQYSCNIFIYLATVKRFRSTIKNMFHSIHNCLFQKLWCNVKYYGRNVTSSQTSTVV